MRRPRGTRSSRDVLEGWRCLKGNLNLPEKHEFFDTPALVCGCKCGQQYDGEFDFSLGEIEVNGETLLGIPMYQRTLKLCTAFAFAKQMEITKRVRAVLLNKPLVDCPIMDAIDFDASCEHTYGKLPSTTPAKLIKLAELLKTKGILNQERTVLSKASDVSTIQRDNIVDIVRSLADGFPLSANYCKGKRSASVRYCRPYKPPFFSMVLAKKSSVITHSVVLVGAGRKKGRFYFYYMDSKRRFGIRRDKFGQVISTHTGIAKIAAKNLHRNVIRLSRFKEAPKAGSFVFPQKLPLKPDCHNSHLVFD